MKRVFDKPKATLIYHYEDGLLNFIIGIYPEYQQILEGAISAQFPNCSIEQMQKPKFFKKKFYDIMPMQPKKEAVYNIKLFKQQPDDPTNNVIDAIGKVSRYDTLSIVMPIKPIGERFNKKAQKRAEGLYRNDKAYTAYNDNILIRILKILNPFALLRFLFSGPSSQNKKEGQFQEGGKDFVRMVKAKEDYLNSMGEEAGLPFFNA